MPTSLTKKPLFKERNEILASFAILILMSSQISFAEEFVPELPQVSYDEIENELVENEDKERSPSNSDEEQYISLQWIKSKFGIIKK